VVGMGGQRDRNSHSWMLSPPRRCRACTPSRLEHDWLNPTPGVMGVVGMNRSPPPSHGHSHGHSHENDHVHGRGGCRGHRFWIRLERRLMNEVAKDPSRGS
jgi:hypothetical protein